MVLFKWDLFLDCFPRLLSRLHVTLFIVAIAMITGFLLGSLLSAARLYRVPILEAAARAYVSFIRGIPILVLLFIVYIGLPLSLSPFGIDINRWDTLFFVLIAYALNTAAFMSETIRSAIAGVDPRQSEAAYSVGLTRFQTFVRIIVPQAVRIALPSLGNSIIALLKDTSLAYTVGVMDLVGIINSIRVRTDRALEAYTAAAIIFFILSFLLENGFRVLDRKLGAVDSPIGKAGGR